MDPDGELQQRPAADLLLAQWNGVDQPEWTDLYRQVSGSAIQCTTPDGTASGTADGPLTGGQLNGNKVSYSDGECSYSGSITGNPPNRAQGNVNCSVPVAGTSYPFTGSWQLSR